ncbi:MAG: hypothetical protein LC102_00250 [Ignavibacteriales bacterium]|nr:MAG: hypothetical protein F9K26_04025 [Ignavibacteriaceae bacterium]MBW7872604.1 hypothetical protein [Ignavibacteria bacterium]MCZ2141843.1 hypothetical protein [Ignavibacteriales bacterium]OQY73839.1 MAG: hypothetical protein B6D45_07595 [Ignavibacteriales bacterium UTCHB3]MBV6445010.1 hypothetical protein [Ignavibacteriaceae bacterium]
MKKLILIFFFSAIMLYAQSTSSYDIERIVVKLNSTGKVLFDIKGENQSCDFILKKDNTGTLEFNTGSVVRLTKYLGKSGASKSWSAIDHMGVSCKVQLNDSTAKKNSRTSFKILYSDKTITYSCIRL